MTPNDPKYYINGVLARDRRILAKTITLIESTLPGHRELGRAIIDELLPRTGNAVRLGVTGVPGVGKSTFIESLGMFLLKHDYQVAVLAVDPSSTRSGGSIMADKTRMDRLACQDRAFIRPSPSSGTLGGVARKTRETLLVCEAFGFDVILIETVGVGQSEITVASMVDFFLVLMLSGAGDELQGIKRGVLELADAIAINKADGDNLNRAEQARRIYETALHLLNPPSPNWSPPVLTCSAQELRGIDTIWETVLSHNRLLGQSGELTQKRRQQAVDWMWTLIEEGLRARFSKNEAVQNRIPEMVREVEKGTRLPTAAAAQLLFLLDKDQGL